MIQQKRDTIFSLESIENISNINKPLVSIIANPEHVQTILKEFNKIESDFKVSQKGIISQIFIHETIPFLIYTDTDPVILRSLLTVSSIIISYYLQPQLQTILQSKWWQHKSLSHIYNIQSTTTIYFFNSRIKVNKHIQNLNYLLPSQLSSTILSINSNEPIQSQLNLQQTCQLLSLFIHDQTNFKNKDYFTDRLNYIELFKLQKNRQLLQEVNQRIKYEEVNTIISSIKKLDVNNREQIQRKIKKMQIFKEIVNKQDMRQINEQKRQEIRRKRKQQKQKNSNTKVNKWQTNKVQYIQRLVIIALVIWLIQVLFGHNLFTLAISLILAIFYLKFAA